MCSTQKKWLLSFTAGSLFACFGLASVYGELPETVDFNFHIRPILSDRCYTCHGPDEENREADLRLDVEEAAYAAFEGGEASHIVKPGEPEQSELYLRIASQDSELRMPPEESNLSLSATEVAMVRKWIEQGAEWKRHWSFVPVEEVAVPDLVGSDWGQNEIDRFVLSRLNREGLRPAREANREKLIRRVTYDLTGLPPTLDEIDDFLADTSDESFEKIVDRLLSSPRFGERMAVEWLDVARYADTYGYQADVSRPVWPWRDWVVDAFNENMSYRDFIVRQLAGDLLPNGGRSATLATAFNRLHRQTNEGGSIEEEFRVEYVADRTETFATAFLGLTFQCARCHDHKYDPLSQQDYYQLSSFFDNIDESGLYSHFTSSTPTPALLLPKPEQEIQLAKLSQQVVAAEEQLEQVSSEQQTEFEAWLAEGAREKGTGGLIGDFSLDAIEDGKLVNRVDPDTFGQVSERPQLVAGKIGKGLHLSGENNFTTSVGGNFSRHDPFSIQLWINTPDEKNRAVVWHRSRSWTDAGSRGYQLLIEEGKLSASLIHFWPGNAIGVRSEQKNPTNRWLQVLVTYDGSSRAEGLKIYVDGQLENCVTVRDHLTKTIAYSSNDAETKVLTLGQRFRDRGFKDGLVDELKVYDRSLTSFEAQLVFDEDLLDRLQAKDEKLQSDELRNYFLHNHSEAYRKAQAALQAARKAHGELVDSIAEIMVMNELPTPRPTYILNRGEYGSPGKLVKSETPTNLPPMAEGLPRSRLGLARWLTHSSHPLTARVTVNRYWQMFFGLGLVATPNDFGSQGELPSHPELLNWLAKSFVDSNWDVKGLLKQIVMSTTYRQSGECSPELRSLDPTNRLLARGPRNRLSAEMLRDGVLYASDLLIEKRGGPPVKPYQPEGLWEEKGSQTFSRDEGEGSHRRSLYTFWKRTSPPPAMLTFDAAKRDVCLVQRQTTSTPLQALVLLNDPQYVEAARALAQQAMKLHETTDEQLAFVFRRLTSRKANNEEAQLLHTVFDQQEEYFQSHLSNAKQFISVGDHAADETLSPSELAAMTTVVVTVANFTESVTK